MCPSRRCPARDLNQRGGRIDIEDKKGRGMVEATEGRPLPATISPNGVTRFCLGTREARHCPSWSNGGYRIPATSTRLVVPADYCS
jgi:hypothetical protein